MTIRLFGLTLMLLSVAPSVIGATSEKDDELWLVLRGQEANRPVIASARQTLVSAEMRKRYVNATTLEWTYPVKGKGMPSNDLLQEMYSFEEQIDQALVKKQLLCWPLLELVTAYAVGFTTSLKMLLQALV